jgi:pantetheine-phosphate adenylyltransferase
VTSALYPGSFDPPTNGHIDVAERACRQFETVIVAVVTNPSKQPLFDSEERTELLKKVLAHLPNVQIVQYEGLTVDLARDRGVGVIMKGLRAVSDLESELQMAQMNATLLPEVDTFFVATSPKWSFISSSLIREVARLGGSVGGLVPPAVEEALREKFPTNRSR